MLGSAVMDFGGYANEYENLKDFCDNSFWNYNYVKFPIMYGVLLLVLFPLSIQKDISKLSFSSFFGVFTLVIIIIIVAIQSPWYIQDYWNNKYIENDPKTHLHLVDLSVGFITPTLYFFRGMATVFYSFCCHYSAYPVLKTLENRTEDKIKKILRTTIILAVMLYLIVGNTGYLSNPLNTPPLIIERYKLFSNDIVITIARMLFIITVAAKIPTAYNSFRLSVLELVFKSNEVTTFR